MSLVRLAHVNFFVCCNCHCWCVFWANKWWWWWWWSWKLILSMGHTVNMKFNVFLFDVYKRIFILVTSQLFLHMVKRWSKLLQLVLTSVFASVGTCVLGMYLQYKIRYLYLYLYLYSRVCVLDTSLQLIMIYYLTGLVTASVSLALLTRGSSSLIGVNLFVLALTPHNRLPVQSGFPKALCLDHSFFSIYTSPISEISRIHNVQQQQYADDTQL